LVNIGCFNAMKISA